MVLWDPNDGPHRVYEEDTRPSSRKREIAPIRQDARIAEYDWQKGEGPSAPDARNMAMPLDPGERPFKLGWVRRGKPGAPESAMRREAREHESREAEEKRLAELSQKTAMLRRRDFIASNRDRCGVNPITGEVYDARGAALTEKALVRGPKSLPQRPEEASEFDARRERRAANQKPAREAFLRRQGAPEDAPERASASDAFLPLEVAKTLVPVGEGIFDTRRNDDGHAGLDGKTGIGPGFVPTAEAAGDGIFAEGRVCAHGGKDSESGLGPGLVPQEGCSVPADAGFLHGAAMFDYRRQGFRNGGGWK